MTRFDTTTMLLCASLLGGCLCTTAEVSATGLGDRALVLTGVQDLRPDASTWGELELLPAKPSQTCVVLNASVVLTANELVIPNQQLGGYGPGPLPSCFPPTWRLPPAALIGGRELTLKLTDSSGSASATFPNALAPRQMSVARFDLIGGQPFGADWLPLDDALTEVASAVYVSDAGDWVVGQAKLDGGTFLFIAARGVDAGSPGSLQVTGTSMLTVGSCQGFASCAGTLSATLPVPATYVP